MSDENAPRYIIEVATRDGTICESYPSYEEAVVRVSRFPADVLTGMPLVFKELADGSQRLVRDDGKPLQWHRLADDRPPEQEEPIPVPEDAPTYPIVFDRPEDAQEGFDELEV